MKLGSEAFTVTKALTVVAAQVLKREKEVTAAIGNKRNSLSVLKSGIHSLYAFIYLEDSNTKRVLRKLE